MWSRPPENWEIGKGYMTKEMVQERFREPGEDTKGLLCGPPGLVDAMKETLMGWGGRSRGL